MAQAQIIKSEKSDDLSRDQHAVFDVLCQMFPNHQPSVVQQVVKTLTPPGERQPDLELCLDKLVNISPNTGRQSHKGVKKKEALSPLQKEAIDHLTNIFPHHEKKVIHTSVCHPSNLFHPLASHTLIQRCIDDLLDGRTALEVSDYGEVEEGQGSNMATENDGLDSEDEVYISHIDKPVDVLITGTEKPKDTSTLFDSDDDIFMCEEAERIDSQETKPCLPPTLDIPLTTPVNKQSSPENISDPLTTLSGPLDKNENNNKVFTSSAKPTVDNMSTTITSSVKLSIETTSSVNSFTATALPVPKLKTGLTKATASISLADDNNGIKFNRMDFIPRIIRSEHTTPYTSYMATSSAKRELSELPCDSKFSSLPVCKRAKEDNELPSLMSLPFMNPLNISKIKTTLTSSLSDMSVARTNKTKTTLTSSLSDMSVARTNKTKTTLTSSLSDMSVARTNKTKATPTSSLPDMTCVKAEPLGAVNDITVVKTKTASTIDMFSTDMFTDSESSNQSEASVKELTEIEEDDLPQIKFTPKIRDFEYGSPYKSNTSKHKPNNFMTKTISNANISGKLFHVGNSESVDTMQLKQSTSSSVQETHSQNDDEYMFDPTLDPLGLDIKPNKKRPVPNHRPVCTITCTIGNDNDEYMFDPTLDPLGLDANSNKKRPIPNPGAIQLGAENSNHDEYMFDPVVDPLGLNTQFKMNKTRIKPSNSAPMLDLSDPFSVNANKTIDLKVKSANSAHDLNTLPKVPRNSVQRTEVSDLNKLLDYSFQNTIPKQSAIDLTRGFEFGERVEFENSNRGCAFGNKPNRSLYDVEQNQIPYRNNVRVEHMNNFTALGAKPKERNLHQINPTVDAGSSYRKPAPATLPNPYGGVPNNPPRSNATVTIQSTHQITYNTAPGTSILIEDTAGNQTRKTTKAPSVTVNIPLTSTPQTINIPDVEPVQRFNIQEIPPAPKPPVVKTAEDLRIEAKNDVLALFPDVDPGFLDTLTLQLQGPMAVNNICNHLLETPYPKKTSQPQPTATASSTAASLASNVDYFKDYMSVPIPRESSVKYQSQAFTVLTQEYNWLSANDIRKVNALFNWYYAPTYQALSTIWTQAKDLVLKGNGSVTVSMGKVKFSGLVFPATFAIPERPEGSKTMSIKLLKSRRPLVHSKIDLLPELQREIDFVKHTLEETAKENDHQVALQMNEQEYEDEGQCIECGCCYGEYPFDNMVQCYEGHLFCENCLRQYAKESIFGHGKAALCCMTDTCESSFPKSQLVKALSSDVLAKYEDRVKEENLNLADIGDLVRCPHCEFAAIMDPGDKVFRCQFDSCQKETCRYCKEEWTEHFGKKCEELEKKDETQLRLAYEEKMTMAKVRACHRCKAQFTKEDGCNKMTCRCGAKMCYICRKPNIDYHHFCQHPREPGHLCKLCKACSLWSNPDEDDNRAVSEIQKEAEESRKNQGFLEEKLIGAPEDLPPSKKVRR